MCLLFLVYVAGFFSLCECQGAGGGSQPKGDEYVLNFNSPIYVCDDDKSKSFIDTTGVEASRFNETVAFLTGYMEFMQEMKPGTMVEIKIEKIQQGRTEMLFSIEICDFCDELSSEDSEYRKYFESFGFPPGCPFDAGVYNIQDLVADTQELPINAANSGSYTATLTLNKDTDGECKNLEFYACMAFDFVIELA